MVQPPSHLKPEGPFSDPGTKKRRHRIAHKLFKKFKRNRRRKSDFGFDDDQAIPSHPHHPRKYPVNGQRVSAVRVGGESTGEDSSPTQNKWTKSREYKMERAINRSLYRSRSLESSSDSGGSESDDERSSCDESDNMMASDLHISEDVKALAHRPAETHNPLLTSDDFDELLAYEADTNPKSWRKIVSKRFIEVWKKQSEGVDYDKCSTHLVKAFMKFEGVRPMTAKKLVLDLDYRTEWDPLFMECRVVDKVDALNEVIYFAIKAPPGITNRDFVQFRAIDEDENGDIYIVYKQGEHEKVPPRPGFIRAETILAGYIIRKDPDDPKSCTMTAFSQNDVKGFLPVAMQNYFAPRATANWCSSLKKACLNYQRSQAATVENLKV